MSDKPKFDPTQPFDVPGTGASKPKFDPGKPFEAVAASKAESPGLLTRVGKGAESFLTGGGGIGEGIPVIGPLGRQLGERFRAGIDYLRAGGDKPYSEILKGIHEGNDTRNAKFSDEHPILNAGQKIFSGIGGAAALPVVGAGATGVGGAIARVVGNSGTLMADTALRSGTEDDIKRAGTLAAGIQGGIELVPVVGKVAGPLAKPIAEGMEALGGKIANSGAGRATKAALGNLKSNYQKLGGEARIVPAGNAALDEGVVSFGDSAGAIARKAQQAAKDSWAKVEETFAAADAAGVKVDGAKVAQNIRNDAATIKNVPKNLSRISELENEAKYYESKGSMSLKEAQAYKGEYDWKSVDKLKDALGKNGNNLVNRAIGDTIKDTIKTSGLPGAEEFAKAYPQSGMFGSLASGAKKTSEQLGRGRSPFSLTDYIAGGAGGAAVAAATGDKKDAGISGLAIAAANSLARNRGNAALAVTLRNLGQAIASKPQQFSQFADVLGRAAQEGTAALAATHELLLQSSPSYRKAIEPTGPVTMPIAPENPIDRRIKHLGE